VAPKDTGLLDHVGMFAVGCFGAEEMCRQFEKDHDDYSVIMTKALADRLAEAFAEHLHERVRREFWGYSQQENLDADSLLKIKYQVRYNSSRSRPLKF
jgi:5-methyltetrahydrofolate--homocysteine methyltransferase